MRKKILSALAALPLLLPFTPSPAQEVQLDTDERRFSYALGTRVGWQLQQQLAGESELDLESFLAGMMASLLDQPPLMSEEEIVDAFEIMQRKEQEREAAEAGEKLAAGAAFMDANREREGVSETESGLQYRVLTDGDAGGISPTPEDTVIVHYQGTLINGEVFDSSYARGEPAQFSLGGVIRGWTEILQLMKPGDKWEVAIPPQLAYGEHGAGDSIGPNETLVFDIELLEVRRSANQ